MLITFGLPIIVRFLSDPCFIHQNQCLLFQYLSSVFHCDDNLHNLVPADFRQSIANERAYAMHGQGRRVGLHKWRIILRGCEQKIILARKLLRQAKALSQVAFCSNNVQTILTSSQIYVLNISIFAYKICI